MAKRGNGEGTITKLKNGSYMGKIMLGYKPDGTPNRISKYGKTRSEVSKKLIKAANDYNTGKYVEPSKVLLSDWMENWLKKYKKMYLKPKTYESYKSIVNFNLNPYIGNVMLKDLQIDDIQHLISILSNKYAPSTVKRIYTVLFNALEQAFYNEMIVKNPAKLTKLPKIKPKMIKVFTLEQQISFQKKAQDYRLYEAFIVNLDTGLRRGELLALQWDDVDFKKEKISINKNIVQAKNENTGKYEIVVQDTPKTVKSNRDVPLTNRSLALLKKLKVKQQSKSPIVFCSQKGTYINPENYTRTFNKILKKAELKGFSPHCLRHSYATRCFEEGVPLKTVSDILGHSKTGITSDIYTHVMPNKKKEAAKALDLLYS
jgi:integrase